jgi:peptidoglycan/xylan/chitin deacetylase (PgdA/CDA1 family)
VDQRAHRLQRVWGVAILAAVLAAGALLLNAQSAGGTSTFQIRLEAGPHAAVTLSPALTVTGHRSLTLAAPTTVRGTRRTTVAGRGVYLHVASGALAGWWVAESRMAYRPGILLIATYSPPRTVALASARYELYRFDAVGSLTAARGIRGEAGASVQVDRAAVVNGERQLRIAAGSWSGWWLPGTLSAPAAIACTTGSPPTAATGRIVRSVPAATGKIALTFDMGGRLTPALSIVRYLERERVCATIFPTGITASTSIGRQVIAEIRAHPELFELGNHTQHHCNLRDGGGGGACPTGRPAAAFVTRELTTADAAIAALAARHTAPYWRPPYGAVNANLVAVAAAAGYPYTVMWSVDTIDWRPPSDGGPSAASVAAKVVAHRKPGAIALMHLGGYPTRNALPAMLTGLYVAGYTPTSLSGLYR